MNKDLRDIALRAIYQISHILLHQHEVSKLLQEVMDILQNEMNFKRATFTLKRDNALVIEASKGLTVNETKRGTYKIGEGITGKVAQKREAIVVPDISKEPEFLDRTRARKKSNVAFFCVPIKYKGDVIGTFSIDFPAKEDEHKQILDFLETVANILADAVATFREEQNEKILLKRENDRLRQELDHQFKPSNIIGNCSSMRSIYRMISHVANSPATVLIRGESGTGKELVAKALHYSSTLKNGPFIAVNCAALPENLIESELFGHEKGSFTGASNQRKGRFELANGGTIFLDEIGDISLQVQVRLLRVLQEKVFERVGGTQTMKANFRVIAATSRNLEEYMEKNLFREDLYYRLNVFPIHMPPLRERKSDLMLLVDHFLDKYNKIYQKNIKRISTPAINMLMTYHWPGNVRELESCIERAILMSTHDVLTAYEMPPSLQTPQSSDTEIYNNTNGSDLNLLVNSFEKEIIVNALKQQRGNVAKTARTLNTTERIIHYKIKKLNINFKDYKY